MQTAVLTKYVFRIRTRAGVLVENLCVSGKSEDDARNKISQIYNKCDIIDCKVKRVPLVMGSRRLNYDNVVDMIIAS